MYVDSPALEGLMFKCVDVFRQSGNVKPDVTTSELGDFIEDGGLVWVVINRISDPTVPEWQSNTNYRIGQRVNGVGDYFSLECVSYAGRADVTTTPNFFREVVDITGSGVDEGNLTLKIAGNNIIYFQKDDVVEIEFTKGSETGTKEATIKNSRVATEGEDIVTIITLNIPTDSSITSYDKIYPTERPTVDGQLEWELVEDPTKIQYGWDSYVTFKHEIEILED